MEAAAFKENTLICRDTKGKVRVVYLWLDNIHEVYTIHRGSGLFTGKKVYGPNIVITDGKVKRTAREQAELTYNSMLKKYLDKGYKDIKSLGIENLTLDAAEKVLGITKTDANNNLKPMLCKILDKTNTKLTSKHWLSSYKHDGLRVFFFWKNGGVHTSSRGGQDYDVAATYIRQDPFLNDLLHDSDLILDGELYRHGWNLQKISGLGRKQEVVEDHKELKFHCYDLVLSLPFRERLKLLNSIREACPKDSRLVIVEHVPVTGLEEIMKQHDKAVLEGYEGLVIRDPDGIYKCGARDDRMLKIKEMTEDSFKVVGYELGLRGVEDMCFVLTTKEGKTFKAKPEGDKEVKEDYMKNINDIIGRPMDVRFFNYTPDGIPNLPVAVCPRYDL